MGKAKAQTKHLRKKGAKKAPKQTNLTGLKKPGDPPASPATEPLQIQVSSPRPRLSSDPEKKRKLNTTTEQKQKNHAQKCMVNPPHRAKAHQGKSKAQKNQNLMLCRRPKGAGGTKGGKKPAQAKEPSHP